MSSLKNTHLQFQKLGKISLNKLNLTFSLVALASIGQKRELTQKAISLGLNTSLLLLMRIKLDNSWDTFPQIS